MKVKLAYGKQGLIIDVPDDCDIITPKELPGLADERKEAFGALRSPIGTRPLKEMVGSTDRVAIVISDMTRPTPNHKLVPWLLEELSHVPRENFVVINGTGSHRENTREELISMLGKDVVDSVRVINNNAFDKSTLSYLGRSSKGAEVYLNKEYVESDFRIATGFIEPHFFAGFSGGPKGIMPGIAGIETILHFHNARMIGDPLSTWGILEGNPVQEEALEIAKMSRPDFLFNVALNGDKQIAGFFAGDLVKAHRAGCEFVRKHAMAACRHAYDIVVTTNSGYPLDQNLYQAVKGLSAAHKIVKRGGSVICAAECCDGLPDHGNYASILKMRKTPGELLEMIENPEFQVFDQWQVQKQAMVQRDADVFMLSSLEDEPIRQAMLTPVHDIGDCIRLLAKKYGQDAKIAVMPFGPLTIPYIGEI